MPSTKTWLFIALGGFGAVYIITWLAGREWDRNSEQTAPTPLFGAIGFVTTFFDTLGIGSFATTTSLFKLRNLVKDEVLPGTLNVGLTLPTIAQAFIYIAIVEVEMMTLILLITASVLGMWLGAGIVSGWPRRNIQIGMGVALLVAATLLLMSIFSKEAAGGLALDLHGIKLWVGIAGNFTLGALMSMGIGLYGPCLIMISLLGMDPRAAFPIMMGSCAFLMPVGSVRFVRKGSYDVRASLGLGLGGIPAVLIAAFIVKSLDLYYVRWLVVVVVVYTALSMLRSAAFERKSARRPAQPSPIEDAVG
ncbi:MAG TPA: TSUP family transporter [Blastocatellia bacterium]|nr:TSUP family transporter [Blastocatellia bacterium]